MGIPASSADIDEDGLVDPWVEFETNVPQVQYQDMFGIGHRLDTIGGPTRRPDLVSWPAAWGVGQTRVSSLALIRTTTGLLVAATGTPYPSGRPILPSDYRIAITDPGFHGVVDLIQTPVTAPPGLLPPGALPNVIPCGDLDGDGFDEFLVPSRSIAPDEDPLWLLIDGSSRTVKWSDYYHPPGGSSSTSGLRLVEKTRADRFTDVNGDGVLDPVLGYTTGGTNEHWLIRCLSGADGALIWEYSDYLGLSSLGHRAVEIGDIDGDGHGEVALRHGPLVWPGLTHTDDLYGYLRIISGRTGSVLWSIPLGPLDAGFVPGVSVITAFDGNFTRIIDLPDLDGDAVREVLINGWVAGMVPSTDRYFVLSGADGALIDTFDRVRLSTHPWWLNDPGYSVGWTMGGPVGDIDGDGWPEWLGWSQDSGPSLPSGNGLSIGGIASLRGPSQVQEGASLALDLWLPGAPNLPVRFLASDVLDIYDGYAVGDGRNTHLGASPLLNATRILVPLVVPLDAAGKASMQIVVPAGAGLAGKRLYLTGVVGDPAADDGIRCLTNTYSVEILP